MHFEIWKPRIQSLSLEKEISRWFLISGLDSDFAKTADYSVLKESKTRAEFVGLLTRMFEAIGIDISTAEVDDLLALLECKETMDNLDYPNPSIDDFKLIEKVYIAGGFLFSLLVRELKSGLKLLARAFQPRTSKRVTHTPIDQLGMSDEDIEIGKKRLSGPKSALWRLHIDWEHQSFGPHTYEEGYHSSNKRHRERGYLNGCENAHNEMIKHVGKPIDLALFTEINRLLLTPHRPHRHRYELDHADITRIKHTTDEPFINDIDKKFVRKNPFRKWEAYVFGKYLKKKDYMFEHYPYLASYFKYKYGDDFKLTKRILNEEMYRYQVSYTEFRWFNKKRYHEQGIIENLRDFYLDMEALKREKKQLYNDKMTTEVKKSAFEVTYKQLLRIARFQKWIEYLHAFSDGTSRQGCMLANKVLVEYGFNSSISCFRHDSRFYTDEIWAANMCEGMSRWKMIALFSEIGILEHALQLVGNKTVKVSKSE